MLNLFSIFGHVLLIYLDAHNKITIKNLLLSKINKKLFFQTMKVTFFSESYRKSICPRLKLKLL